MNAAAQHAPVLRSTAKAHDVTFAVDGNDVLVHHTMFGAQPTADGGRYNAEQVSRMSREDARKVWRHYTAQGYIRAA